MRQALIVDDSKTARYALRQLLVRRGFEARMLSSAEEALEYLRTTTPTLIFMDHMMPGMDGFQAVKAIKADPRIADVPIVMYTSREGEVYVGQARALGAADIMTKPARSADLEAVLKRLHLDTDVDTEGERPAVESAVAPAEPVAAEESPAVVVEDVEPPEPEPAPVERASVAAPTAPPAPPPPPRSSLVWPVLLAALLLVPVAWLLYLYIPAEQQRLELVERQRQLFRTLEWSLNQNNGYPWGERPLQGERLERFRELISQLASLGFQGTVLVQVHVGEFCLTAGDGGTLRPAPAQRAVTECDALGLPALEAMELSQRQGPAFRRFLERSPVLASGDIEVEWLGFGSTTPREEYPLNAERIDASAWNEVAARNHRIELELIPQGP